MRDDFEVYYKGCLVPLPSGEDGRGNFVWDDEPKPIWEMTASEQSYWNRLMAVPIYNEEEQLKMDRESERYWGRKRSEIDPDDETLSYFAALGEEPA